MMSERLFAIVVGFLMLSSLAGFAMTNIYQEPPKVEIPAVIEKVMDPQERVQVLQTGKVLIEYLYPENCVDCTEKKALYQSFVNQFSNYAVLEIVEVPANQTMDHIIGMNGDTIELGSVSDASTLMNIFCSVAILQPKECLMMEI